MPGSRHVVERSFGHGVGKVESGDSGTNGKVAMEKLLSWLEYYASRAEEGCMMRTDVAYHEVRWETRRGQPMGTAEKILPMQH
jgi:hypothetical protein